jgi:homoserine dehydrogenase
VSQENQLSTVENVFNAITVVGNAIGEVMFYGRGAGKLPTASAVVADVMDAAKHKSGRPIMSWEEGGADVVFPLEEVANRWYIRGQGKSAPAGAKVIPGNGLVFLTEKALTRPELDGLLAESGITADFVMRVLD